MSTRECDIAQRMIETIVETVGVKSFITGLHNASCHGDLFSNFAGQDIEDKDLQKWFKALDKMRKVVDNL